jgi:subtilisin family serine protease
LFDLEQIPAYHEGMLILKVRSLPDAVERMVAPTGAATTLSSPSPELTRALEGAPGLQTLSVLERGGLIEQVIPLSRPAEQSISAGVTSAMGVLATSTEVPTTEDRNAGVNLVQVKNEGGLADLQGTLARDPNVEFVSRVPVRYLTVESPGTGIEAVPLPTSVMWNLQKIQWEKARALPGFREANEVQVAVLDTGVDLGHPDLKDQVSTYVFDHPHFAGTSSDQDIVGHGTHVAGTIAADNTNNLGVNGICNCRLRIWKIFDDIPDLVRGALFPSRSSCTSLIPSCISEHWPTVSTRNSTS